MTKVALVSYFFPPAVTIQRPLKLAVQLAARGIETHVVAPADPKWMLADDGVAVRAEVAVHRVRYPGPPARRLGDELFDRRGAARALTQVRRLGPRLLIPDEVAPWLFTATPATIRLVRRHGVDVVITSSWPSSVHLLGAAVKYSTGAAWIADVRDSLIANPNRRLDRAHVRAKNAADRGVARLVARCADAVVAVSDGIAAELESLRPRAPVAVIRNGCDFEDFDGLAYSRADRFRLTHTGSFYGARDPRPVLAAVARTNVVVRFAGDFRPRDRAYAAELGVADRVEVYGHVPHRRALELQRDSEALLLLVPNDGAPARATVTAKVFEYLAAGRPILAAVPHDGEAAAVVREGNAGVIVDPDDVEATAAALAGFVERFMDGTLEPPSLSPELRVRFGREARGAELAALVQQIA